MPEHIPSIRVFISSPGDLSDERKIALDVIEQFPDRPTFREKVAFRVIAWDKRGAGTPMRATITPQEAINNSLPIPAECDIVIVMFWSRMGTPFVHSDGVEYKSGTHWELLNALEAKSVETVIYLRTDDPPLKFSDSDFDTKYAQYKAVQDFFKSDLFYDADGKIKRGINMYKTPDDFRHAFEIDLEVLVLDILKRIESEEPERLLKAFTSTELYHVRLSIIDRWQEIGKSAVESIVQALPYARDKWVNPDSYPQYFNLNPVEKSEFDALRRIPGVFHKQAILE